MMDKPVLPLGATYQLSTREQAVALALPASAAHKRPGQQGLLHAAHLPKRRPDIEACSIVSYISRLPARRTSLPHTMPVAVLTPCPLLPPPPQEPEKVSAEQLEAAISGRDKPLVVDFFATWCGPCVLLADELKKVATELGDKVRFLKVDVDENPELSSQLQIQGLPTLIFIGMDPNKPALRTEGLLVANQIKDILDNHL